MALIVGQYYRGNPNKKPKQWGPLSTVLSTALYRLGNLGNTDTSKVSAIFPFWSSDKNYISSLDGINTGAEYTYNGLLFDSADKFACDIDSELQKTTYIIVAKISSATTNSFFRHGSGTSTGAFYSYFSNRPLLYYGDSCYRYFNTTSASTDGKNHIWSIFVPGTTSADVIASTLHIDGTEVAQSSGTSSGAPRVFTHNLYLGGPFGGFTGEIEFLLVVHDEVNLYIKENPYSIIQPPAFRTYFDLGASTGLLNLTGSIIGASNAAGELSKNSLVSGDAIAQTDASGSVSILRKLSGTVDGVDNFDGQIDVSKTLSGSLDADTSIDSELSVLNSLAGDIVSTADAHGEASVLRFLSGSVSSTANIQGELLLQGIIRLSGGIGAVADTAGQISIEKQLSGVVEAISDAVGQITVTVVGDTLYLSGGVSAGSDVSGSVSVNRGVSGAVEAIQGADGTLLAKLNLSGSVDAIANVIGELSLVGEGKLGVVIDPTIESVTINRLIESISIKYTMQSK